MAQSSKATPRSRLEQREQEILEAATRLFATLGFQATSTRKIAKAAGVSEGTIFHYFASKNELLTAIIGRFYDQLVEEAQSILHEEMDTRTRLYLLAVRHVKTISADNALLMRLIQLYFNIDLNIYSHIETTAIHKFNQRYTQVFDNIIKEGIQRGDLKPDLNLNAIRDLLFGGLEYGMRTLAIHHQLDDIENYVGELTAAVWKSIASERASGDAELGVDERLAKACKRVEAAARELEKRLR